MRYSLKLICCCLVFSCLGGCSFVKDHYVTAENCYAKYPAVVIDSSFVISTVVRVDSFYKEGFFRLDSLSEALRTVYEDSLYVLKAALYKNPLNNGIPIVHYQVQWKERNIPIKAANVDSLVKLIDFYKHSSETLTDGNKKLVEEVQEAKDKGFWSTLFTQEGLIIAACGFFFGVAAVIAIRKF